MYHNHNRGKGGASVLRLVNHEVAQKTRLYQVSQKSMKDARSHTIAISFRVTTLANTLWARSCMTSNQQPDGLLSEADLCMCCLVTNFHAVNSSSNPAYKGRANCFPAGPCAMWNDDK